MELTKREHDILYDWITFNLIPIKSFNDRKTSYGLKHIFEADECGFYVTNDDFKEVMFVIHVTLSTRYRSLTAMLLVT